MRHVIPSRTIDYNIRRFYEMSDMDPEYLDSHLRNLWEMKNLSLDPKCLCFKLIKTSLGEMLIENLEFKTRLFLLKFVGKHFVFIHNNTRRVIPICSHLQ